MSWAHHSLTSGGITKTLEAWGVTACTVTRQLGGEDSMELTLSREADAAAAFGLNAVVSLLDPDGARRFRGVCMKRPRFATPASEGQSFQFEGPSAWLKVPFRQDWRFAVDPLAGEITYNTDAVPLVILHRDATGAPVNLKNQIQAVLDYAINEEDAPIAYNVAAIPTVQPPEDEQQDRRCWDILRSEPGWAPHISCRWNYSPATPVLLWGDTTEGTTFGPVIELAWPLDEFQGGPCDELLVRQVVITYIYQLAQTRDDGVVVRANVVDRDSSTITNGALARMEATVVLRGPVWTGSGWEAAEERPANGLAASLHKAYGRLFYDLSWSETAQEVDWSRNVGQRVNFAGATYGNAEAVLQTISRDLVSGRVSYQCGPPEQMGLGNALAIFKAARLRNKPQHAGEQTYGMQPPEPACADTGATPIRARLWIERDDDTEDVATIKFAGREITS